MPASRSRVRLVEADDPARLDDVAALAGSSESVSQDLSRFLSSAADRLRRDTASARRTWLIVADRSEAGLIEAVHTSDAVELTVFVAESHRGRGLAREAVGRLFGAAPWHSECSRHRDFGTDSERGGATYVLTPSTSAERGLARSLGFTPVGGLEAPSARWSRAAPARRAPVDDVTRFLDRNGRIDRYPAKAPERRKLLEMVAERALEAGSVVSEAQVNALLEPFAPGGDVAVLRRYLIDHGILERTRSGSQYSRPV